MKQSVLSTGPRDRHHHRLLPGHDAAALQGLRQRQGRQGSRRQTRQMNRHVDDVSAVNLTSHI